MEVTVKQTGTKICRARLESLNHSLHSSPDQFRLRVKTLSKKQTMGHSRPLNWQPRSRSIVYFFQSSILLPEDENQFIKSVQEGKGNRQN